MEINNLTHDILKCAYTVHTALGPGLLESAYKECLYYELVSSNFRVEKEKSMPLIYKEVKMEVGYRIDLLVENKVIIELKSVENISDVYIAQLLTYMKLADCKIGLLINFNVKSLKDGIKRYIL